MSGSEAYRVERDSLGDVHVPQAALYGAQTARAVENFRISGLRPYRAFIWSMATIKHAAADVNAALGLLEPTAAQAIAEAAEEVRSGRWDDHFVVDPFQAGAGTSHNMNTNEVIANRASQLLGGGLGEYRVHPNDHVNMAQSTNDTIPTAIRLGCLWRLDELLGAVADLALALQSKSAAFDSIVKSGRTHLQDAVPIRLGQEFGGYATAVARDGDRIRRAADGLRRLGIGGTAVGTGLNAHPEYHARMVRRLGELTGLELQTCDNLFEAMQSMADAADFSASLRTLAITLTRIANDFRLLASGPATGLDEIRLPAVQPGSSIMPGKVNPVQAEMLNMAMFHIIGCDTTVALGAQAGQLELNVMDAGDRPQPVRDDAGDDRRPALVHRACGARSPGELSEGSGVAGTECYRRHGADAADRIRRRGRAGQAGDGSEPLDPRAGGGASGRRSVEGDRRFGPQGDIGGDPGGARRPARSHGGWHPRRRRRVAERKRAIRRGEFAGRPSTMLRTRTRLSRRRHLEDQSHGVTH
jgi:fumarate hydratase class II